MKYIDTIMNDYMLSKMTVERTDVGEFILYKAKIFIDHDTSIVAATFTASGSIKLLNVYCEEWLRDQ